MPTCRNQVSFIVLFALTLALKPSILLGQDANEFCGVPKVTIAKPLPVAFDSEYCEKIAKLSAAEGDAPRGMSVFRSAKYACVSCHQVGQKGGSVGPSLNEVNKRLAPTQIVEAILWPSHTVKPEYTAWLFQLADGQIVQGYKRGETDEAIEVFDPAAQKTVSLLKADIDQSRETGTLMPTGMASAMSLSQRRDLVRFLLDLEHDKELSTLVHEADQPVAFTFDRAPLTPALWNLWQENVNRDRVYDFYRKQAIHFASATRHWHLLPAFPGLDGGKFGHWGNQNEAVWKDARWSQRDKSPVLAGVTHLPGQTVNKGVCVQLGDEGALSTCFDPETLTYAAVWKGGFVKFSEVRHGFMDGLRPAGPVVEQPKVKRPDQPFQYHGYYRVGPRIVFSYRIGDTEMLDAPWEEDGKFSRTVMPVGEHPLATSIKTPPTQWPQEIVTYGKLGRNDQPYAIDTIELPQDNPWGTLMFVGDHDFLEDGTAVVATMTGDVWLATGLDADLDEIRWKRFATGLHQPLGVAVWDNQIYVLGRDQISRLVDHNDDREADFYECFSNVYDTSPGGHDYICGLEIDSQGRFYTASGKDGLLRISADGKRAEVLATGFRNPDGLGITSDGKVTVPCSEGAWTPASMVCLVDPSLKEVPHFGYRGPKKGQAPSLPLVYMPRGLDNSSGGQAINSDPRFGPLQNQLIHTSFGMGTHFLVLRDEVDGQAQGAVKPLPGEFRSGAHRAATNPADGQLYVSGMAGWGSYTPDDGCLHRVRYTGKAIQMPVRFHVYENGVLIEYQEPIDSEIIRNSKTHFAQAWNYRYGPGYGSPEMAPSHPNVIGHEAIEIAFVHSLDEKTIFVEMPDLQPVNQLHLLLKVDAGEAQELFVTVHKLDHPFDAVPNNQPGEKVIAAHPLLRDLALLGNRKPNPWQKKPASEPDRKLHLEAGKNLTYSTSELTANAGELIELTFANPDVVPHNWVLIEPGTLATVGDLANKLVADPEAALNQYVPDSSSVLTYTDIVDPEKQFTIYFQAPEKPGRYPYFCSFPGHWMVMNGVLVVE
ncbi:Auracyanin-A precursor [Bremerella volcania]|uniref:Auracyanin-A n=1 Tax=Bremerella volcania TaxID=2527984 RepID=A0A518CE25_9BACT|nr:DUF6797 domain-containing protein [Bremerella volcania]QDU77480.1 Auracyanin-A precursor [Bremerella volcania]